MFIGMAKIGAGLLAATLTFGGGAAAAQTAGAWQAPLPDRQVACERYQQRFAQNLGITVQQLRDTREQTALQLIDEGLAAGKLTPEQAQQARERVQNAPRVCERIGQGGKHGAAAQIGRVELQAVAQKLGISERELVRELRGGKSLAQVAGEHNVGRDELKATMRAAFKGELDKAVQAGKLTQEGADKALAAFDARIDRVIDRTGGGKP
jgi:polyhydroxyalkanoate synthesis regulator phasin